METYFFFGKSLVHHVFQVLDLPLKHVHLRSPSHFRRRSRYSSPSMVAVSTSLLTCSDFTDTVDALLDGLETSPRPFEASAKATAQPRSSHLPKPGNTFLFCFWFTPTPNISICERQHPVCVQLSVAPNWQTDYHARNELESLTGCCSRRRWNR